MTVVPLPFNGGLKIRVDTLQQILDTLRLGPGVIVVVLLQIGADRNGFEYAHEVTADAAQEADCKHDDSVLERRPDPGAQQEVAGWPAAGETDTGWTCNNSA